MSKLFTEENDIKNLMEYYRQQGLENKMAQYDMIGISYQVIRDSNGLILDVITDEDSKEPNRVEPIEKPSNTITTNNTDELESFEMWHDTFIVDDLRLPMPTHCLKNKNYNAKEYGALMTISNRSPFEGHRYLYKNKFNTSELAKDLGIGRTTLERNIKKLEKLDCNILSIENTRENGVVYKLDYGAFNEATENTYKYVTIYQPMLKTLVCTFNNNAIKLYCLLNYMTTETEFKAMDNKWLAEQIGLSPKSKNNLDTITEIVSQLELCGFIETEKRNIFRWDEKKGKEVPQISKFYRLRTLEQWQSIQNKVKNKKISN